MRLSPSVATAVDVAVEVAIGLRRCGTSRLRVAMRCLYLCIHQGIVSATCFDLSRIV